MTRYPALEGKEVVEILREHGFQLERQRGSHCFMRHSDGRATVVPVHAGETIGPGLMTKILRDVGLTRDDLIRSGKKARKK